MEPTETQFSAGITPLRMRSLVKLLSQLPHSRTSFKRSDLFAALQQLGWHVQPVVEMREIQATEDYRQEKDAQKRLASLQAQEMRTKPSHPVPGRTYVAHPKYEPTAYGHTVSFDGWDADEAWEVSDPTGRHAFVMGPEPHARVRKRDRLKPDALLRWLNDHTDVKAQAKAMVEDTEQRRRAPLADTDSGTCGVCLRNLKLEEKAGRRVLVLHGYERPGTGRTQGRCMGVGYPPYELSPEASTLVLKGLEASLQRLDEYIGTLLSPWLTEFVDDRWSKPKVVTKEQAGAAWRMLLDDHIAQQKRKREDLRAERDVFRWLVDNWRKRELPQPGERAIDWYTEARRQLRR